MNIVILHILSYLHNNYTYLWVVQQCREESNVSSTKNRGGYYNVYTFTEQR